MTMPLTIDQYAGLNHHLDRYTVNAPWIPVGETRRLTAYNILAAYATGTAWQLTPNLDQLREYGEPALLIEQTVSAVMGDSQEIQSPNEDVQAALRDWATHDNFLLTLLEAERKTTTLGDAVYLIEAGETRPHVSVIDPGFYFPVYDDDSRAQYPTKVHLGWEYTDSEGKAWIKRTTYELKPVPPYSVPWADKPATLECFVTEAKWRAGGASLNLAPRNAIYSVNSQGQEVKDLPMGIDFIPVIHLPNTVTGVEHYGTSILTPLIQLLDDLYHTDTDATAAAATTGTPMLAISDPAALPATSNRAPLVVKPGAIFNLNKGGTVTAINTAPQLAEIRNRQKDLLARLSRNARIPEVALGATQSTQSGVALQIQYSPLNALVRSLRLARAPKYGLLLKFLQRFLMLQGVLKTTAPAQLVFGAFMPKDQETVVKTVTEAVTGKIMTIETGIKMLEAAGIPVTDDEAETLKSRDYAGAIALVEATGDTKAARNMLGIDTPPLQVERRTI